MSKASKSGGVAKRTASVLVLRILGMVFGYLLSLVIGRWYGAGVLGGYALIVTIVSMLSMFATLGLEKAVLRYVAEGVEDGEKRDAWNYYSSALVSSLIIASIFSVAVFALREVLALQVFDAPDMSGGLAIGAWVIVLMVCVLVSSEALRAIGYSKLYALLKSAEVSAAPLLFVALFEYFSIGDEALRPINGYLWGAVSVALVSIVLCYLKLPGADRKLRWSSKVVTEMVQFGFPVLISSSLAFIMQWADTLMLGVMRSPEEVGIYSVAFKLAIATTLSFLAVNVVITPSFARPSFRDNSRAMHALSRKGSMIGLAFAGPAAIVLIAFGEILLGYFGEEFQSGYRALVILVLAQVFVAYAGSVSALLNMTDHQRQLRNIMLIAVGLKLIMSLVLIPRYGIDGAAVATGATLVLWNILAILYIKKVFGFLPIYVPRVKA